MLERRPPGGHHDRHHLGDDLSPSRTYPSLRAAWIPLAALCLAFFVEMVDNTLLSIALPTIGRDLGSGTTALQWVTGAYSLTFGGLLLTAGSMADRLGRRRVLLVGLAVFGLLSLCVVAVTTAGELIALRAALGIAAAAMAPITNSLVFRLFDDAGAAHARHDRDDRRRHVRLRPRTAARWHRAGPRAVGVAAGRERPDRPDRLHRRPARRTGRPTRGPDERRARPARRRPEHHHDRPRLLVADQRRAARLALRDHHRRRSSAPCVAGIAFVWHERRSAAPMLDLGLFSNGTVRGAAIAQIGTSIAMASVMFGLILHFQYAYGWSPMKAGLANLPIIVTMIAATPFSEWLARRSATASPAWSARPSWPAPSLGLAWAVDHGYAAIAVCMVLMTIGLRTVMTICAVALVDAMPSNRTSIGTALNDTAQEVGTSVGTAVIGTMIAALVTTQLPAGTWSSDLVASFFHGERITYALLAVVVGLVTAAVRAPSPTPAALRKPTEAVIGRAGSPLGT